MSKATILTYTQLADKLANLKGSSFVYIETDSMFKDMNKRGNPFYNEVRKHTKQTVLCGFNYGNAVNNRLKKLGKEANFEPTLRPQGRSFGNALIEHKGTFYMESQAINCLMTRYVEDEDNSTEIAKDELIPFFNAKKRKEMEQENNLLKASDMEEKSDEEKLDWACQNVYYRNYSFNSITRVHMDGETYVLVEDTHEAIEAKIEALEEEFELV